jgi:hypothetical protein
MEKNIIVVVIILIITFVLERSAIATDVPLLFSLIYCVAYVLEPRTSYPVALIGGILYDSFSLQHFGLFVGIYYLLTFLVSKYKKIVGSNAVTYVLGTIIFYSPLQLLVSGNTANGYPIKLFLAVLGAVFYGVLLKVVLKMVLGKRSHFS